MRSGLVQTNHGGRTSSGQVGALVDVATALGGLDESLGTRALTLGAHLAVPAVIIDVAARLAEFIGTNFPLQTILV